MSIFNALAMGLAFVLLILLLLATRRHESSGWWLFRLLISYSLISFAYLAYDAHLLGANSNLRLSLVRYGYFALALAMLLFWRLVKRESQRERQQDFTRRIKDIFHF